MTAHLLSRMALVTGLLGVGLLSGCVERRYIVITDPPMAMVLENGRPIGPTPVLRNFDYYGIYRYTLQRDGYQTMVVDKDIEAPWYEYPPFDFFVENILPFTIRDYHEIKITLVPPQEIPYEQVRDRAQIIKEKALPLAIELPTGPMPQKLGPPASVPQPLPEAPPPQKLIPEGPPPQRLLPPTP